MKKGFTFIEVLVAMLIFVLAVLAAVNIASGSVRATKEAKQMTIATWLLQNVMVELETKIESEGVDKGCEKKKESKFEAPYQNFTWTTYCDEISLNLSQSAAQAYGRKDGDDTTTRENIIAKAILSTASDYLSKSLRELHVEVSWMEGKNKRKIAVTTHFAKLDQPFTMPAIGVGGATQ